MKLSAITAFLAAAAAPFAAANEYSCDIEVQFQAKSVSPTVFLLPCCVLVLLSAMMYLFVNAIAVVVLHPQSIHRLTVPFDF